ncbi:DNA repair protein RecO [Candidatus Kaiserbacteria bacterium]|nr:DNA repair protein RecO [Candidatus Kaiserbacteria bacterium]
MSHHRYQTRALVLGSTPVGEADRFIDMFTEDLGRVRAIAKSVREERSKLRFSLQDFSVSDVSLVRGREVWRLVGAENRRNIHNEFKNRTEERYTIIRLLSLLKRLLNGEEENKILFRVLSDSLSFLHTNTLNKEELSNFECLIALRVLYNLGYLAKEHTNAHFLETTDISTNLMSHISPIRFDMVKQINISLQESQL